MTEEMVTCRGFHTLVSLIRSACERKTMGITVDTCIGTTAHYTACKVNVMLGLTA
jgi:hypothetical protein